MIKKEVQYQGLDKLPVLIEDKSPDSSFYFRLKDIPSELTGGKNLIKIRLSPYLRTNSDIQFEILDYNGNPIYYEFTNYLSKDGESRVISIWIYEDAPPGLATIYLVGTATRTPENAPIGRQQSMEPNLRWSKKIQIVPDKRNSTPILFEVNPSASITEVVSPYLKRTFSGGSKDQTYSTGQISYRLLGGSSTGQLQNGTFPKSIEGGILTVSDPTDPTPSSNGTPSSIVYKTKIRKLLDTNNVLLSSPYEVQIENSNIPVRYGFFGPSTYQIDYEEFPSYVATQNSWSYAYIDLNELNPITGDVYRIKTSRRGPGLIADWEQVDDSSLEASEILEATSSLYTKTKIGNITSANIITNYWSIDNTDNTISPVPSADYNTTQLNNSVKINTKGNEIPTGQSIRLETQKEFKFQKGGQYIFKFDAYAERTGSASTLNIYLSGSSFNWKGVSNKIGLSPGIPVKGKKLLTLYPPDHTKRYDDYQVDFEADETGEGKLIFEAVKGTWYLSEIGIKSSQETGFTPSNFKVIIPIETRMLNDEIDFKFEYFDYLGNQSNHTTYILDKKFIGGNTYIDGANNLLTGSMYIGRKFGSGIEQSGKSSGMIRSTKYKGFNSASAGTGPAGWMMWSGSALRETNPTYYQGVGLELHGGQDAGVGPDGSYTASGVLQFRSDTRQLFAKGTFRTRFDDGRTMNPPIPFPERMVIDDTTNTMKFYLTGSTLIAPTVEIGSNFEITNVLMGSDNKGTGLQIIQPREYSGSIIGSNKNIAGIYLREEIPQSLVTVDNGSTVLWPSGLSSFQMNKTGSQTTQYQIGTLNHQNNPSGEGFTINKVALDCSTQDDLPAGLFAAGSKLYGISAGVWNFDHDTVFGGYFYAQNSSNTGGGGINHYAIYSKAEDGTNNYSFYGALGEMLNADTYAKVATGRTMIVDSTGMFGNATSDKRLKSNIITIGGSLDKIRSLRGVYFNWKDTGSMSDRREIGMIAQEVEKVTPELVYPPDENANHYSINYQQMAGLLVEAIKEQQTIIDDLTARISTLESGSIT